MSTIIRTPVPAGATLDVEMTLPAAITTYENVIVYLYTAKFAPVKFSYIEKQGYGDIIVGATPDKIKCKMLGSQSINMCGQLVFEIFLVENSTEISESIGIGSSDTTIDIIQYPIREEV